jgi:hypothetical protein
LQGFTVSDTFALPADLGVLDFLGMVWYGMVWYGMVWYGMVWYGMVIEIPEGRQDNETKHFLRVSG